MLLLLLIPAVTGLFNFEYMKANFRNVEEDRELFMFLGNSTSMYLQTNEFIELVLLEDESFEIYRSPLTRDINFIYNEFGFHINGDEMELSYNQGTIQTTEAFQVCYDFSTDRIIFEAVIGFLAMCLIALTGKVNQDYFIENLYRLRVYISKERETQA